MPDELSSDDVALLALLASGLPTEAVARRLGLSDRTVRRRTRVICDRLGVTTTVEAVAWVGQAQWLLVAWAYWVDAHRQARVG